METVKQYFGGGSAQALRNLGGLAVLLAAGEHGGPLSSLSRFISLHLISFRFLC